jgi:HPt (histidine-containing phosphotransfer) domain-containing protein
MDYMMPDMDGIETFSLLKKENPGFDTPVIALTANAVKGVERRFLDQGFTAYLTKPVMWQDLESTLAANLPADLVLRRADTGGEANISAGIRAELRGILEKWGVSLDKGSRYVADNIHQYKTVAGFFVANYDEAIAELEALHQKKDWEGMRFAVHSLKSKAKSVGAGSLHQIAAWLEQWGLPGDGEFVEKTLPPLFLQWERAYTGLGEFCRRMDELFPEEEGSGGDAETILRRLYDYLSNYQAEQAESVLKTLLSDSVRFSGDKKTELEEIKKAINDYDYKKARDFVEDLLKVYPQ